MVGLWCLLHRKIKIKKNEGEKEKNLSSSHKLNITNEFIDEFN
jgi:hypothetical protein